jgi:hypothetical protein
MKENARADSMAKQRVALKAVQKAIESAERKVVKKAGVSVDE